MNKIIFTILFIFLFVIPSFAQLVNDFRVNDDTTSQNQGYAQLGVDKSGNFVIVWEDQRRNGRGNIYCQRFDSLAHRLGNNFIINTNLDTASYPCISVRKDGSFGVCWYETNSIIPNRERIKFRLFNNSGAPINNEIIIKDTLPMSSYKFSIDSDTSGKFTVALNYYGDIFFQKIDKFGNKIGGNVKINDDTGSYGQGFPDLTVRPDGSFIVCWQDARPPVPYPNADDIFMQMFDSSSNKIGNNSRVNDVIYLQDFENKPSISSDTSGAFCITFTRWNNIPNTDNAVIQYYDKNGTKIGSNINVVNSTDTYGRIISKRENGDMIIGFTYYSGLYMRQYIQRRNSSGGIIGNAFQVSNVAPNMDNWFDGCVLFNNKIISVITDYRNGNPDVFCNIRSFINPDSVTKIITQNNEIPAEYKLFQNYPNPFNPITNIKYQITNNRIVTIKVFDLLGREIETLVNEKQKPGTYEVQFPNNPITNNQLPSGIYFYTLYADGVRMDAKKMILIK